MANPRSPSQKARDQKFIAEYYLQGCTQEQIVQRLKDDHDISLCRVTVTNDLKEIRNYWKECTNLNIDEIKTIQINMLMKAANELWKAWYRSIGTTTEKKVTIKNLKKKNKNRQSKDDLLYENFEEVTKTITEIEQNGDPRYIMGIRQILCDIAEMTGLLKRTNIHIEQLTIEQIATFYAEIGHKLIS